MPTNETLSSEKSPLPAAKEAIEKVVTDAEIPLTPPEPGAAVEKLAAQVKEKAAEAAKQITEEKSAPPPPPAPKKIGFFGRLRRLVTSLLLLGIIGFSGGVWYSRINDSFHDFFTEYIPYGEQAVLYLEELEFRKKFSASKQSASREIGEQVKIPAHSGASWRVADSGEPVSRRASSAAASPTPAVNPVTDASNASTEDAAKAPGAAPPKVEKPAARAPAPAAVAVKGPEVNEPSRFLPLEPIDLLSLPDAKEPIVQDVVRMLNDLILVINADGAHSKYSNTIDKAKAEVASVGKKLKDMKGAVEQKAAGEVRSTITEFDKSATDLIKRVENTMAQQEVEWRQEFEKEMQNVRKSYDERVELLLQREKELNEEKLRNSLLEQAIAMKKEFVSEVESAVEKEREGRLSKLEELSSAVSDLQKLTVGWNNVVDANLKTQQMHVAVEAVRASIEEAVHPRPFIKELVALKEIAADDDVVDAAIASVNPTSYQKGVASPSYLIDRFRRVANEVRKASLLPDDAGVASHASSWVLSHLMFKKQGLAEGDDVESILTRTQILLEEGDLDAAAREMNGLQGWAKTLSRDWLGEVRKVLEVQQALDVIATEARLQSLRVD